MRKKGIFFKISFTRHYNPNYHHNQGCQQLSVLDELLFLQFQPKRSQCSKYFVSDLNENKTKIINLDQFIPRKIIQKSGINGVLNKTSMTIFIP